MMGIWYKIDNLKQQYIKVILFNRGSVKIVVNSYMKRKLQSIQYFKDGAKFLDAISTIFSLDVFEFSELNQFILTEY